MDRTHRILVADDNHTNVLILNRLLKRAGYEILEARDGREAIEAAIVHRPDLILLDVMMPEMDGLEVCRRLKDDDRTAVIPIIYVTAKSDPDEIVKGLEAGGQDYITKPFHCAEVQARVSVHLRLREAEQELRQSEQRLELALEGTDAGLWDWNLTTGEVFYSRRWVEMLGYHPSEFAGHQSSWENIIHPDDRQRFTQELEAYRQGTIASYDLEHRLRTQSGQWRWVHTRGKAVDHDMDGRPTRLIGTQVDISERKYAEESLRQSNNAMLEALKREKRISMELEAATQQLTAATEEAKAATQAKSEFLANMSHEIRTPMTAILGFAENLLDPTLDESDRLNATYTIQRNGEHLLQIINDILDISKIEAGKLEVELIRCSPVEIVGSAAALIHDHATAKGLTFEVCYDGPVPERIETDPTRLRQIIINLLTNAVKFTSAGRITLSCRLRDEDPRRIQMEFTVRDSGIGMTAEQADRIFQPFAQADSSTTRKFGGTGLGLTISRRLANMLGGNIRVETAPAQGSAFHVTVSTGPLHNVPMIEDPNAIAWHKIGPGAHGVDSETPALDARILVAEDGPDNQRLITFVLRKAGAEVYVVDNGQDAVDQALKASEEGRPFDIILMDIQMPIMDGYKATRTLRQAGYAGPIVALTAHAMEGTRETCTDAGCNDYASKPIDRTRLLTTIQAQLAQTPSVPSPS